MHVGRLCLLALLVFPLGGLAQKKQLQELQRDMALLQDEVRTMGERMSSLTILLEQVMDRVNNTNTSVTVLDSSLKQSFEEQQKQVSAPVANIGAKVDQMSDEFRFVRESVNDLTSRVGKLQAQVTDLKTSMQIMSAPPPPPAGGAPTADAGSAVPPLPSVSADALFNNAQRDQSGGKPELALMQYQDFLQQFPNSNLAPQAQYEIGQIHFTMGAIDDALKAFDLVLEKYPENPNTSNAMFMKALSLQSAGQRISAAREFRALVKKYPDTELAARAQAELAKLGY